MRKTCECPQALICRGPDSESPLTSRESDTARGYLYAITGSVCAGSMVTLTKLLLVDNLPEVVVGLPYLLSGFILLLYHPRMKPSRGSLVYLLFFGLIGAALAPLMYAEGLEETTAVNAALLGNAEVLFTVVLAYFVLGERLSRGQAARATLIVAGLVVVSTNLELTGLAFLTGLAGNLLVLGATLAWAVENNLIAVATRRFDPAMLTKFRSLIGGAAMMAFVLAAGLPLNFTGSNLVLFVLLALAASSATYLFIAATKKLGATRMLLVWSSYTVFGALFAYAFLGEQITLAQLSGAAIILLGVYLLHRGEPVPQAEPFVVV